MDDGHFIDDPLLVAGVKPDFSGMGLKKKPGKAKQYAPLYEEPEDVALFNIVRKLVELGAEFDIKVLGLHITNKSNE
jgi:hypothetical protein